MESRSGRPRAVGPLHPLLPSWNSRQGIPGDSAVGLPYANTEFLQLSATQVGHLQKDSQEWLGGRAILTMCDLS